MSVPLRSADVRIDQAYDVVIMGGGPAGTSLAARLARETELSVALFEKDRFPREHIGESFASPAVPCLQETGVLEKVLDSECYIKKFGGYYAWDDQDPSTAFFRHGLWEKDGYRRWSLHVNRPEFDKLLLDYARSVGVDVTEGGGVAEIADEGDVVRVGLTDGQRVTGRLFVDASGRSNRVTGVEKAWLSDYRNIAIWRYFVGGRPAQSLPGDWNIFRDEDLSPIGSFAFQDGWCWYIPVMRIVNGRRVMTHSVGIVTDPALLQRADRQFTKTDVFVKTVKQVPLLSDLLENAEPLDHPPLTTTNYSRISARMCDFDRKWLLVGDAAYFVDPLFSSGVSFALLQAAAAAEIIKATLGQTMPAALQRELWDDYTEMWSTTAQSYAILIDQWYAAIAKDNPDSVYWNERATPRAVATRMSAFHTLLNGGLVGGGPAYILMKKVEDLRELSTQRSFAEIFSLLVEKEPAPGACIRLRREIAIKESLTLDTSEGTMGRNRPDAFSCGPYWANPVEMGAEVEPLIGPPRTCHRFYDPTGKIGTSVKAFSDERDLVDLCEPLRAGSGTYAQLQQELNAEQWALVLRLLMADMVQAH